jgi:hypothetical protein
MQAGRRPARATRAEARMRPSRPSTSIIAASDSWATSSSATSCSDSSSLIERSSKRARVGEEADARVRGLARAARRLLGAQQPLALGLLVVALGDVAGDDHEPVVALGGQRAPGGLDRDRVPSGRTISVTNPGSRGSMPEPARRADRPPIAPVLGCDEANTGLERVELLAAVRREALGRAC